MTGHDEDRLDEMAAKILAAADRGELRAPDWSDPYELADRGIRDLRRKFSSGQE